MTTSAVEKPMGTGADGQPIMDRVTAITTKSATGHKVAMAPDAGWNYNPGKAEWRPDLEKIDHTIARQFVKDSLNGPDFELFYQGKTGGNFTVAVLRPEDKKILGSLTQSVLLSADSLTKNKGLTDRSAGHPELGLDDYRKIPDIIDRGEVYRQGDERLIYLKEAGKWYRAALKRTKDGLANYFLTLFKTTEKRAKRQVIDKYERIR